MEAATSQDQQPQTEQTGSKMMASKSTESNGRYCWVCFATDEDDETAAWVQPCKCKGTTKWVNSLFVSITPLFMVCAV